MRRVDKKIVDMLCEISKLSGTFEFWERFYCFIIESYKVPQCNRFGVSDLFYKLENLEVKDAGEIMKVYAHGLYIVAKLNGEKLYEQFNV